METRFVDEAQARLFYGMGATDVRAVGKRNLEWDLNDWKWDGDLFVASSLKPVQNGGTSTQFFPIMNGNSSNSSSSCSDEVNLGIENGKRELEKRRRVIDIEDDNLNDQEVGSLSLKIGGHGCPIREREMGNSGKKTKLVGGSTSRAVCQVEDCGADLSKGKDYHRRHKVCEMHSKASKALVGNLMQRFCQQCSRFHVLQEFDEGKRSCRRRLAGHNKRRRKTNPAPAAKGSTSTDEQTSSYLLISLLQILSNMHSNRSDQLSDQGLLSHLLRSLASQSTENGGRNISGLLQEPRDSLNDGSSFGNSEQIRHADRVDIIGVETSVKPSIPNNYAVKMNNFDLNDIYVDSDDGAEDIERSPVPLNLGASSIDCPSWLQQDSHQSSPPHNSGNSDSASPQSPSSSNGDVQCRTDRIIFKLFGKEPNDFPLVLRAQILDWLSNCPTDIESYIRPGCVILTIYLRQAEASWEELCCNLSSSLSRLMDASDDPFWRTGWICVRVLNQISFFCNGQVVVDKSLPLGSSNYSKILSVKPIALPACGRVEFVVKGVNLCRPTTRLLCAVEGKYMVQEKSREIMDGVDNTKGLDELQCVSFCCSIPTVSGRGFIEIEDHGLSSSFFPFIVAEEDVCSEICMLEDALEFTETDAGVGTAKMEAKNQAMDFIHEIGWLLHRNQLKFRLGNLDPSEDLFPLRRFKWLVEFSMDHEWCAVVKKLLNMLLLSGVVDIGDHSSLDLALAELCLLHKAVRKNSRSLVELLLTYVPEKSDTGNDLHIGGTHDNLLFRPDAAGPAGLTPLHIAAGKDGSEDVLDALTNDPGMVGIEAWKNARDSTGFTPEAYARLRGHYSYIHMVQKKINKRPAAGHVIVDIPDSNNNQKQNGAVANSFEIAQRATIPAQSSCKLCLKKPDYGSAGRSLLYRPSMLSMVAIAAVCVCVALLFKSCPQVVYMFRPFRWELLEYGTS